jgi:hypothetical protein
MRESAHPVHTRRNRRALYGRSVRAAAQTQVPELEPEPEPELARWLVEAGEPVLAGWTDARLSLVEVPELGPLLAWVRSWRLAEWAGWTAS